MFTDQQLQMGLNCFDPETRLFPQIAARTPPHLTAKELLVVLKWKLGRVKESDATIVRHLTKINGAIRRAGEAGREVEAIRSLCGISGIKLAVASAILSVCYPNRFTIFDFRLLNTLGLLPKESDEWTPEAYWERFVPAVRRHCRPGRVLREVDKALWGLSVHKSIQSVLRMARSSPARHAPR